MRLLVCGDRKWTNYDKVFKAISSLALNNKIECVIQGEAKGADTLARIAAKKLNLFVLSYPANWYKYGKAAGPIRNQEMLDSGKPDYWLAFHNNIVKSKGTRDMVKRLVQKRIPGRIIREQSIG